MIKERKGTRTITDEKTIKPSRRVVSLKDPAQVKVKTFNFFLPTKANKKGNKEEKNLFEKPPNTLNYLRWNSQSIIFDTINAFSHFRNET